MVNKVPRCTNRKRNHAKDVCGCFDSLVAISYNGNVMLAALVCFLFVLLFFVLLHIYAKWFFTAHARHRRRRPITPSNPPRLTNFHPSIFNSVPTNSPANGLSPSAVASIPMFVYDSEKEENGLECVICLSAFEDSEIGRSLPECCHAFHIECIDMWLSCHSNCPVCRGPVGDYATAKMKAEEGPVRGGERREILIGEQKCEKEIMASTTSASSSSSDSSAISFERSLKRMLSRNRSEIKVFPCSSGSEIEG